MTAVLDATDLALSNESCRIFIISSSLAQGITFIDRVRKLGNVQSQESSGTTFNPTALSMPVKIPWTISNKYYSAFVHFAAHTVHGLSPHHLKNVPAVIFVWAQGEPYRDGIERIAQDLTGCEPEVCLAVRVPHLPSESVAEDESEIDAFLSSHGFEYVDATEERPSRPSGDLREENFAGIPRISRVLDALSTILWPSMETKTKADKNLRQKDREFLDWAQSSQDDRYSALEEPSTSSGTESFGGARNRVREMQELARWLEEDDSFGRSDPWRTAASTAVSLSPTSMEIETGKLPDGHLGFDDDFTGFVSAPAVDPPDSHDNGSGTRNMSSLLPPHGDLYWSLGSVSDFGDSDDGKQEKDSEDEDDVPTQEEIRATSSRIFGIAQTAVTETGPGSPSGFRSDGITLTETFSFDSELETGRDDDSYEMAPFDLSKVIGTLEEMKAEIGRMENEGERRKAAARVALGLVYGLEEGTVSNMEKDEATEISDV